METGLNKEDVMDTITKGKEKWNGAVTIEKSHPLFRAVRFVCAAVSKDELRQQMLGVCVRRLKGMVKLYATDGRRLHIAKIPCAEGAFYEAFPQDETIMGVATNTATKIVFSGEIDGNFPDYEKVIPDIEKAESAYIGASLTDSAFTISFYGVKINTDYLLPLEGRKWTAYINAPHKPVLFAARTEGLEKAELTAVIMPLSQETDEETAAMAAWFDMRRAGIKAVKPKAAPEAQEAEAPKAEPEVNQAAPEAPKAEAEVKAEPESRTKEERKEYAKAKKAAIKAENEALVEAAMPDGIATNSLLAACQAVNVFSPMAKYASPVNFLTAVIHGTLDARTFKGWMKAGRRVKKGAKAFYIDKPRIIGWKEKLDPETQEQTREPVVSSVPCAVFRFEDTEGKEVPYEPMGEAGLWAIDALKAMAEIAA
jgi:hypothetical protein